MKIKILSVLMVMLMTFCSFACTSKDSSSFGGANNNPSSDTTVTDSNKLQILKSDFKFSEEDMVNRIKAEYLIENNGYKDNDEIIVTLTLEDDSLIDRYDNYAYAYDSVADFASSAVGKNIVKHLQNKQSVLIRELTAKGLIGEVTATFSTILNAVSAKIKYSDMQTLENYAGISSVIMNETYNLPKTTQGATDVSAIENAVDIYETGIFKPVGVSYDGNNTSVAVLDSGFDCSHSVFQTHPEVPMFKMNDIIEVLPYTNAAKITKNIEIGDVYYSDKIPFAYDYADKDSDVFPFDSEHGTHVAGIIGGQDETITGIAKNTQLVLMKVFPDLQTGAETDDILTALEDAVLLGVDAINLSLGSSCGFTREEDGNKINTVYDKINESGISLIAAASNDYSSAYGGAEGNTNKVTNPDSATVGSPSTYTTSLSVASISGKKSRYLVANNEQVIFFNESSAINSKPNDFFKEIGIGAGESKTYEYITIPGNGLKVNYTSLGKKVEGKIALVRRGDNTFEEKAALAKAAGAVACIIYNNVEGDILMSMGKSDHIPTISISKEDGVKLASKSVGTLTLADSNQAGPFMSDFSSWGPTSDLKLKPEITAHGGDIYSAMPGGGYDYLSGTSMASPNMCGVVILIRQHLKEQYPNASHKEISVMANQLLMSTATIVLNEQGNPYSPRKQGAGLASLKGAVTTPAYITVDGIDRSKLELGDDKQRTGKYVMEFNVVNLSTSAVEYDLSVDAMTESVSSSDSDFVAEKSYMLNGSSNYEALENATINGNKITVPAGQTAKVKVTYQVSAEDMDYMTNAFPYGMFVEGFVKLSAGENGVNLSVPFLAFYGDWTEAPMFDKTYYEVESEAHNGAIDEEDKLKADYWATTPYGSYYYNYIIPLGTYLYTLDSNAYDAIPATEEHISMSNVLGTIDGLSCVYAGLLRNAETVKYKIIDKVTGKTVWAETDYTAQKAHAYGGSPMPYYDNLKLSAYRLGLVNNREYTFTMSAALDYGDGGVANNVRNSFSFDFTMDEEAPVIEEVTYDKEYDKTLKKDRYYINVTVYDNHYAMSIAPILFTSSSSYTFLTDNPIPIYSEKGSSTTVRFEITDMLEDISFDELIQSGLSFAVDDYALNTNLFICQLPGTKGAFSFTEDGTADSKSLSILPLTEGEVVDLTKYLVTKDSTVEENKDYLKYIYWESSNPEVATVKDGLINCLKPGSVTIKVTEQMDTKSAALIVRISAKKDTSENDGAYVEDAKDATIKKIRFAGFETLFAYSRAAQYSEIGETGDVKFISATGGIEFYPGEKIRLFYDFDPWYAEDNYELTYTSRNPEVASVNQKGEVTALKKGSTIIELTVDGSNLMASVRVTVNSEFIIENRQLIAYKGLGGEVVIPDDEGILYIGAYAFCLYETDQTIELPDDDYDANKIPSMNTTITKIVIPEGVEDIQKYAFYNCVGLKEVVIPDSVKFIREYAFYKTALTQIDLNKAEVIGNYCFAGCEQLESVTMNRVYTMGVRAFEGCINLASMDLTTLRNTGKETFKDCTSLTSVTLGAHTKLSYAMFVNTGLTAVDIYEREEIPAFCFAKCANLQRVTLHSDLTTVGEGAFSECTSLTEINFAKVEVIGEQAFYGDKMLESVCLPNCEVILGNYSFLDCEKLTTLEIDLLTKITKIDGNIFEGTNLTTFVVDENNAYYGVSLDGKNLENKAGDTIIFASFDQAEDFVLDEKYTFVGESAFAGTKIKTLTITNKDVVIGDYAFMGAKNLSTINLPSESGVKIGAYAFSELETLSQINNLDKVKEVGDYAFAMSAMTTVAVADNAVYGEGVFYQSKLVEATVGKNATFGLGSFQKCYDLTTINMPEEGGVHFGSFCFSFSSKLENIDLGKTDDYIEDGAFLGCTSLKRAELTNVKKIGAYAFADCYALNVVKVPMVEEIEEGAFSRYSEDGSAPIFASIELPATLTTLGDGAFMGCEGLLEATIPAGVTAIPDYTFALCRNLSKVVLPESVKEIGVYAFTRCLGLEEINLGAVETIKDYAFANSDADLGYISALYAGVDFSALQTIGEGAFIYTYITGDVVAEALTEIGAYAFQNTDVLSFSAPNLVKLGEGAFCYNVRLTSFTFANTLEVIEPMVFVGCEKLATFNVKKDSETLAEGAINDYAKIEKGGLYTKMESGEWLLSSIPSALNVETFEVVNGTARIETYAGNENKIIKNIILPDGLKLIGNYAFYGYDNLEKVEFNSVVAPALESGYDSTLVLSESAPGFDQLHAHFDLFGLELYYCNFKDLVGAKEPIKMVLPTNEDIKGYDALHYKVYFGSVQDAERSTYVAMEENLIKFIELAEVISTLEYVTLSHEDTINDALTAYNALTQKATDYGYTQQEWDEMVKNVNAAKKTLVQFKLAKAIQQVRDVQAQIDGLDMTFDVANIQKLKEVAALVNGLTLENRLILDLTNYNELVKQYNAYLESLEIEVTPVIKSASSVTYKEVATVISLAVIATLTTVLGIVLKRKFM